MGNIYINKVDSCTKVMSIDIDDYYEFLENARYIFNIFDSIKKVIYTDTDRYYEIDSEELNDLDKESD